jgi:hypothetical protein
VNFWIIKRSSVNSDTLSYLRQRCNT